MVAESRTLQWVGHVAGMGETRDSYDTLMEKVGRKR
jgi:hypothetical protein